jgi:hypothetical protein
VRIERPPKPPPHIEPESRAPREQEVARVSTKDDRYEEAKRPAPELAVGAVAGKAASVALPVLPLELVQELAWADGAPCAAASGIVVHRGARFVIADDALELAVFPADPRRLEPARRVPLFDDPPLPAAQGHAQGRAQGSGEKHSEAERKARKPDLEALALVPDPGQQGRSALLALGSGSTGRRMRAVLLPLAGDEPLVGERRILDLSPLYAAIENEIGPLNIEGAATDGAILRLAQRGNGGGRNALIDVELAALGASSLGAQALLAVRPVELPKSAGGVPYTLTDLTALGDGRWVFTAAAEDTANAYDDGEIAGSAIGVLDAAGAVLQLFAVDRRVKLEGVHAEVVAGGIAVEVVTDNDAPDEPAQLFRALLPALPGARPSGA